MKKSKLLLSKNGIDLRKYTVNDNFFKVWSNNMAYILGFWFADGCIMKRNEQYQFNIGQKQKDKYLLEQILFELCSNSKIYCCEKNNFCCFTIRSKKIFNDLIVIGGKERKSLDVKFPSVPKAFLPDFVRGLWDGDGSIYYSNYSKRYVASYVSGSKDFIYGLHCAIKNNVNDIKGSIVKDIKSNVYRLSFHCNDLIRLRNFMYGEMSDTSLKLLRKYSVFKKTGEILSYADYVDAKSYVNNLRLSSIKEWKRYCLSGKKPDNIPFEPCYLYKNKGWVNWYEWLGKPLPSKRLKI